MMLFSALLDDNFEPKSCDSSSLNKSASFLKKGSKLNAVFLLNLKIPKRWYFLFKAQCLA